MKVITPLGEMLLASEGSALRGAWFVGQKYFPAMSDWEETKKEALLLQAASELKRYFAGELRRFTVPLAPQGTPFQEKIWTGIATIPWGHTITYGELAALAGTHPRAAGSATGRNPVSLFIPCHRVVGSDGFITGYAGGLEKKKALLALEGIALDGERVK